MKPEKFLKVIGETGQAPVFLLGTIAAGYVSGRPTVKLDGDDTAGSKTYPYLASYAPAAGDRVLVAKVAHGAVILGKVI